MGDNSCIIRGQAMSDHCKMQAAYLSKLIYERPQGDRAFDTSWPEEINKARENWQEWVDFDYQSENGFVARLYKPKGYDQNAENGDEMCWPTLVFRGTDMEDFRGLGLHVRIRLDALATLIEDIITRGKAMFGGVEVERTSDNSGNAYFGGVNAASGVPMFDPALLREEAAQRRMEEERAIQRQVERNLEEKVEKARQEAIETTKEGTPEREAALAEAEHADSVLVEQTIILDVDFLAAHKGDYTRKDAEAAGFAVWPELSFTLNGPIDGLLAGEAEIKVEILTKGGKGDWVNNLLQGIGDIKNSSQYKSAIDTVKDVIEKYISKESKEKDISKTHDKRLTITGHSLGGGLATAADFTARYNYYKDNIQIYTIVFNTAGLHEGTIQYIKDDSAYAADVQEAHEAAMQHVGEDYEQRGEKTLARNKEQAKDCVRDPGLSDAAYNIYRVQDEILTTLEYTPHHIPFLEGIMDILDQRFPKPVGVDNQMPALSPGLNQQQKDREKYDIRMGMLMGAGGGVYYPPDRGYVPPGKKLNPTPVLFPLDPEKFPHILALSAIFAKYGRQIRAEMPLMSNNSRTHGAFSLCLNEMIAYLDQALFKGKLSQYINSRGEDRSVLSLAPGAFRGVMLYLWSEIPALQRLLAISTEYHGMDYVIAAYEGLLKQRK